MVPPASGLLRLDVLGRVRRHPPGRGKGSGLRGTQERELFHEPVLGARLGMVCGEGGGSLVGMQPPLTHSSLSLRTPRVDMPGLVLGEGLGASRGPAHPLLLRAFVSPPSSSAG